MYIGFKTSSYVVRHLDSIAFHLPTGLHLGFFRSWPSLYLPSSFSSVFLVLCFVSASTSMLFWVIFLLPFFEHGRPYHVSWFCSISFIIVSSNPISCLIVTFQIFFLFFIITLKMAPAPHRLKLVWNNVIKNITFFGVTVPSGPWPPHSWGFWITHNDALQSVGLLWTSDQLVAETSTLQHTTLTTERHPCPRWDSNPQSQQASCRRHTP